MILTFPGWTIDDVLETDIKYLNEIMFTEETSAQPVQQSNVVSMKDWFKEIGKA